MPYERLAKRLTSGASATEICRLLRVIASHSVNGRASEVSHTELDMLNSYFEYDRLIKPGIYFSLFRFVLP